VVALVVAAVTWTAVTATMMPAAAMIVPKEAASRLRDVTHLGKRDRTTVILPEARGSGSGTSGPVRPVLTLRRKNFQSAYFADVSAPDKQRVALPRPAMSGGRGSP
jgi:hypothetical protein